MLRPGENVDSWCGKCKMMLAHTFEAMVRDKPARVHCNTCSAQHAYKANPPGETKSGTRAPGKPRTTKYEALLKGKDMAGAKAYSIKERYEPGEVIQHPTFGTGVATAVRDVTKVEVLFESGPKVLVHGR